MGSNLPILKKCKGIGGWLTWTKKNLCKNELPIKLSRAPYRCLQKFGMKIVLFNCLLAKVKHLTFTSLKFKILTLHKHCEYFINCQKRVKFFYQTVSF